MGRRVPSPMRIGVGGVRDGIVALTGWVDSLAKKVGRRAGAAHRVHRVWMAGVKNDIGSGCPGSAETQRRGKSRWAADFGVGKGPPWLPMENIEMTVSKGHGHLTRGESEMGGSERQGSRAGGPSTVRAYRGVIKRG